MGAEIYDNSVHESIVSENKYFAFVSSQEAVAKLLPSVYISMAMFLEFTRKPINKYQTKCT